MEPLYRDERIFARLVRVLQDDADADVRDAAYGALLRLAAAPEELSRDTAPRVAAEIVQGGSMLLDTLEELVSRPYSMPCIERRLS